MESDITLCESGHRRQIWRSQNDHLLRKTRSEKCASPSPSGSGKSVRERIRILRIFQTLLIDRRDVLPLS